MSTVLSAGLRGIESYTIGVEVDITNGIPSFDVVGLPDTAVRESRERVRSAIRNSGFEYPLRRITVNLSPAHVRKEGPSLDLAVALAVLISTGQIAVGNETHSFAAMGELSLDGKVQRVSGAISMASHLLRDTKYVIVPQANIDEVLVLKSPYIIPVSSLSHAVQVISSNFSKCVEQVWNTDYEEEVSATHFPDLCDIIGQETAKRVLEIAAAGGHHTMFFGPPGVGKTAVAKRIQGILPPLNETEFCDILSIYSAVGKNASSVTHVRPFRSPHHTVSASAMLGGGVNPKPGELSLAHNGVLFLDEIPEFRRDVLEALRQPLEDGEFCLARAKWTYRFPASVQLIATGNLCPCGHRGRSSGVCSCSERAVKSYLGKVSGPLMDRIDMVLAMTVSSRIRSTDSSAESSADVRKRVIQAQKVQFERQGMLNSKLSLSNIDFSVISDEAQNFLDMACRHKGLSTRSQLKTVKVARTIADLSGSLSIDTDHISEAISYQYDSLG